METARGYITIVQEQRFRLVTEGGQGLLLTLAHTARSGAEELCRFRDTHARVLVRYSGEPGMASGVAQSVSELAAPGNPD